MKNNKLKVILIVFFSLIILVCGGFYIYTLDYNIANTEVYDMVGFDEAKTDGNMTIFMPPSDVDIIESTGIIFYPGGKIDTLAYAPLMLKLAEHGIMCVLIHMPMNLAIFNIDAANDVYDKYPEIDNWYLMGHSLGGAMASQYAEENYNKLAGLIMLGAYPLNDADVDSIIIYGSEDVGLDREKLIDVSNQFVIEGGNHSYFGNYDENETNPIRDGETTITQDEQQDKTVQLVTSFIKGELNID
jgi:dienelactone hydrolase